MKRSSHILIALILVLQLVQLQAQTSYPEKRALAFNSPAKLGDNVSEVYLGKIINHPTLTEAYVNTFKGKLLILDFWNINCPICIRSFPLLDSLQSVYRDKIVILPVGFDGLKKGSIEEWVKKRNGTNYGLRMLPTAIQAPTDTTLFNMFPSQGFPYEIWIDSNGVIIGMTDHTFVNAKNIQKIINKENVKLNPKRLVKHFISGCEESLDKISTLRPYQLDISSRLTGYIDSAAGGFSYSIQCDSGYRRLNYINLSVVELYKNAYNMLDSNITLDDIEEKKVFVVEKVRDFYKRRKDYLNVGDIERAEFRKSGLFCFDLILPKDYSEIEAAKIMIHNLDGFFRINSSVDKLPITCLKLVRTSNALKFKARTELITVDNRKDPLDNKIRSATMPAFIETLNHWTELLVIDETNYKGRIDVDLELYGKYTLQELKLILNKYDLDLIESNQEVFLLKLETR